MTTGGTKWVYSFGGGSAEGRAEMKDLLGGKGANLAEMSNLALPVPPGFTITTEVCTHFYERGKTYPAELKKEVTAALAAVEGILIPKPGSNPRADIQRPSMAQDIIKGRRTEIEQMNGLIARKGAEIGVPAPSHVKLTEIVTKVERGELKPSPSHLGG
jgi:hypothetical protein